MLPFMPMLIGAALGGGISALRGGNPLTGALMGGLGGALGGATGLLGGTTGGTVGGTGGGFVGGGYGSLGLAGQTALQGAGSAAGGGFLGNTMAGIGKDFGALQSFMQQNPVLAQQGLGVASNLMQRPEIPMAPSAGLMRGQQMPQQAPAFAMGQPQISLI